MKFNLLLNEMVSIFHLFFLFSSFASAEQIPFDEKSWKILKYSKITPNEINFSSDQINISVNESASPLIYPFPKSMGIQNLKINLKLKGHINLNKIIQGERGADDFVFRIGLVFEGNKTLNYFQKLIAPQWITTLYDLAPINTGIEKILFYNIFQDVKLVNTSRIHPLSELLEEKFYYQYTPSQEVYDLDINPPSSQKTLAIWLSCDGDDTKSKFQVIINKIEISLNQI